VKKLLVPIDGSENSQRAEKYAVDLAKQTGASLHFIHVCDPVADAERIHAYYSREELEKPARQRGEDFLKNAESLAQAANVPYESEIVFGPQAATLVKRAKETGCDGIIMATRGRGTFTNLFLGSTATKVVSATDLPVTLVK
jgi:nucleotide-binding universal stress UspA family protein